MSNPETPSPEARPLPSVDQMIKRESPITPEKPFYDPGHCRKISKTLPPFSARRFFAPRSSAYSLADLEQEPASVSPPTTPTPNPRRRPDSPPLPASTPSSSGFKTPENGTVVSKLRVVEVETTPSSSQSRRSFDTEGDVRMLNAAFSSPEILRHQQTAEIKAMVMQSVQDNFEFERAGFADEVRNEVLATISEDVGWIIRERVDCILKAAVGEPEESELDAVCAMRERLRRMSNEAKVRVFCTEEMLQLLKEFVAVVDLETRAQSWTLVDSDQGKP